ncbi:MAG TPA: hypothetical protein VGR92_23005 [Steroidobacteraceae bacterium]|nr:hypothetical protein [Steroidobacteraceae bacterium]
MRKLGIFVVAIVIACCGCGQIQAADQQVVADADCVVVGLRMSQMTRPDQRAAGMLLTAYYLGRLQGREPHFDVERLIKMQARSMSSAGFRANAARCGKSLAASGQEIQKISTDLSRDVWAKK